MKRTMTIFLERKRMINGEFHVTIKKQNKTK